MQIGVNASDRDDESHHGDLPVKFDIPFYRLAELLVGTTPDAIREAFCWGPDIGREEVD